VSTVYKIFEKKTVNFPTKSTNFAYRLLPGPTAFSCCLL